MLCIWHRLQYICVMVIAALYYYNYLRYLIIHTLYFPMCLIKDCYRASQDRGLWCLSQSGSLCLSELYVMTRFLPHRELRPSPLYVSHLTLLREMKLKLKQSQYRPGQALRVPGDWGSQISILSTLEGGNVSHTLRPPLSLAKYFWYSFLLEAESTPGL